jgi:hypothetical protein
MRSSLLLACAVLAACSNTTAEVDVASMEAGDPLLMVPRALGSTNPGTRKDGLSADGGLDGYDKNDSFYIAINKAELGQKWFLSAYMAQYQPASALPAYSLGTRVVSFKVQNDKLFVFDVSDTHAWSDGLTPEVLIEAYPIVTDFTNFNRMTNAKNYILIDPSEGLNRFSAMGDYFAGAGARFQIDLSYLQRYRKLDDGAAWEQVFTGYSETPVPGYTEAGQPFRASGTLGLALRRYKESEGFAAKEAPEKPHYFTEAPKQLTNSSKTVTHVNRWAIAPGMKPIRWIVSSQVKALAADPRFAEYDVYGSIELGVKAWNVAFGFPVFEVVQAGPNDSWSDDEKNFIVVDRNPSAGMAFANWRSNPNTGEIRGASVYFSSVFLESVDEALRAQEAGLAADAGTALDAGSPSTTPSPDGGTIARPALALEAPSSLSARSMIQWDAMATRPGCALEAKDFEKILPAASDELDRTLTRKQKVERYLTHIVMHEIGHTLGLRHNFRGSIDLGSVMDYLNLKDSVAMVAPGAYDTQAVKWLYGLDAALPTAQFCTDEHRLSDADCEVFDTGSDPLADDIGPAYAKLMEDLLHGRATGSAFSYERMWRILKYVRAGTLEQQAQAWHFAFDAVKHPIDEAKATASGNRDVYVGTADALEEVMVRNLFTDPAPYRGYIPWTPVATGQTLGPILIPELKSSLSNVPFQRSYPTRRAIVDALFAMQSIEGYQALIDTRAQLVTQKAQYPAPHNTMTDDLIRRIDVLTNPYFR